MDTSLANFNKEFKEMILMESVPEAKELVNENRKYFRSNNILKYYGSLLCITQGTIQSYCKKFE
jgi:hypothetical protein